MRFERSMFPHLRSSMKGLTTNFTSAKFLHAIALPAGLLCVLLAGCQDKRIAAQSIGFHEAVVNTYDEQFWDSLIRARQHRLFVLLNYTELFGQDSENVGAAGGGGEFVPTLFG